MGYLEDIGGTVLTTMGSGTSPVAFLAQLVIASSVICILQVLLSDLSLQRPYSDDLVSSVSSPCTEVVSCRDNVVVSSRSFVLGRPPTVCRLVFREP